jgi:hypothetical protein
MKYSLLIISFLLIPVLVFAQKTKTVEVEYTYNAPENISLEQAKKTALERAQTKAIADEFGTIVTQSTSTVIKSINEESTTDLYSYGGSDVKGEWIQTIGEPIFDIKYTGGFLVINVKIKGKIREIESAKVDFICKVINRGQDESAIDAKVAKDEKENLNFLYNEVLKLYFKSPTNGFFIVFLHSYSDEKVLNLTDIVKVKKNEDIVLFNSSDVFLVRCEEQIENADIYFIFSENELNLMIADDIKDGIPVLTYKDFTKWLSNCRKRDTQMVVVKKTLTINK